MMPAPKFQPENGEIDGDNRYVVNTNILVDKVNRKACKKRDNLAKIRFEHQHFEAMCGYMNGR